MFLFSMHEMYLLVILFYRYALRSPNDATVHMYDTAVNESLRKEKIQMNVLLQSSMM